MRMRHGQWVLFTCPAGLDLPGAHTTASGRHVGIYQRAGVDALGRKTPEQIVPVQPDGKNVRVLQEGEAVIPLIAPEDVPDLEPLLDRADLPPGRAATYAPDWAPKEVLRARAEHLRGLASDSALNVVAIMQQQIGVLDRCLADGQITREQYDRVMAAIQARAEAAEAEPAQAEPAAE